MAKNPITVQAYEVKFALNADQVLDPDGNPTPAVIAALGIVGEPEEYQVAFLDGSHLDFHTAGWTVRFRDKGGNREIPF